LIFLFCFQRLGIIYSSIHVL